MTDRTPLSGRSAIITGASQGLGLAIARAYVEAGANVLMCARDSAKLSEARADVSRMATASQKVEAMAADVSRPTDVDQLVGGALAMFGQVQILVCNAGVYGPIGPIDEVNWDDWSQAIRINIDGSVLPARALVPHFKAHRYGKIIQLSGGGATNPLPRLTAYAASKAAIVRFVESLALELRDFHVDVNAIAPGALNTRMLDEVLAAGPERAGREFFDRMSRVKREGGTPLERGAALAVYLASARSDGITGRLLSAVWDPWESLADRWSEIEATDIYTIRRIVPEDRS